MSIELLLLNTLLICIIILYSIAGVVRNEFNTSNQNELYDRSAYLWKLSSLLKWLSNTYRIAIVVVNQVCQQ